MDIPKITPVVRGSFWNTLKCWWPYLPIRDMIVLALFLTVQARLYIFGDDCFFVNYLHQQMYREPLINTKFYHQLAAQISPSVRGFVIPSVRFCFWSKKDFNSLFRFCLEQSCYIPPLI